MRKIRTKNECKPIKYLYTDTHTHGLESINTFTKISQSNFNLNQFDSDILFARLQILNSLSFCLSDEKSIFEWANNLFVTAGYLMNL